jgi:hypothetical protein
MPRKSTAEGVSRAALTQRTVSRIGRHTPARAVFASFWPSEDMAPCFVFVPSNMPVCLIGTAERGIFNSALNS